jgi:argininosuccinate lyase
MLMLENIKIREDIIEDPKYNSIFSTEEVNRLVRNGIPFRDAYRKVAEDVRRGKFEKTSPDEYTHEGSIGNLCNDEIAAIFNKRMLCFKSKTAEELIRKMMYL